MNPQNIRTQLKNAVSTPRKRVAIAATALFAATSTIGLLSGLDSHTTGNAAGVAAINVADAAGYTTTSQLRAAANEASTLTKGAASTVKETANTATDNPAAAAVTPSAAKKVATEKATVAKKDKPAPASKTLKYDYQLQINYYYCGPAATRIALSAKGHHLSQDSVADKLGTTTDGTNSAADVVKTLNKVDKTDFYRAHFIDGSPSTADKNALQDNVVRAITRGYPVVANIVGDAKDVHGNTYSYSGGHYLTVVGYRDHGKTVKIADPANTNGDGSYWMSTKNLVNWMAQRGYAG